MAPQLSVAVASLAPKADQLPGKFKALAKVFRSAKRRQERLVRHDDGCRVIDIFCHLQRFPAKFDLFDRSDVNRGQVGEASEEVGASGTGLRPQAFEGPAQHRYGSPGVGLCRAHRRLLVSKGCPPHQLRIIEAPGQSERLLKSLDRPLPLSGLGLRFAQI